MATAPKSTGGVAPSKQPQRQRIACAGFQDHRSQHAAAAYYGDSPEGMPVLPALWSAQLYSTSMSIQPLELLEAVLTGIVDAYPIRLDVYFLDGADEDACMAHYRQEKARTTMPFVDYGDRHGHYSALFIVGENWREGVTSVHFDDTEQPGVVYTEQLSIHAEGDPLTRRRTLSERIDQLAVYTTDFNRLRDEYERALVDPSARWTLPESDEAAARKH